ncbi:TPA: hypothetical protein ACFCSM_03475 [Neisseria gonorrhoeae]|nr:hypothetical protein EPH40_06990 [Neisseria gonorrhoeae]TND69016.1 hypothetical protein EPH35_06530 [Neisseria gonorrhoeae]
MWRKYSELTKIRTRRRAAGSTDSTEPVRLVLHHLRESSSLSRGGPTPYRFLLIHYTLRSAFDPQQYPARFIVCA